MSLWSGDGERPAPRGRPAPGSDAEAEAAAARRGAPRGRAARRRAGGPEAESPAAASERPTGVRGAARTSGAPRAGRERTTGSQRVVGERTTGSQQAAREQTTGSQRAAAARRSRPGSTRVGPRRETDGPGPRALLMPPVTAGVLGAAVTVGAGLANLGTAIGAPLGLLVAVLATVAVARRRGDGRGDVAIALVWAVASFLLVLVVLAVVVGAITGDVVLDREGAAGE